MKSWQRKRIERRRKVHAVRKGRIQAVERERQETDDWDRIQKDLSHTQKAAALWFDMTDGD